MKTDYPQSKPRALNIFTNTGIIISLLLTTIFSALFMTETSAETMVLTSSKKMELEASYVTEKEKIKTVEMNADLALENGIEKIKEEEAKAKAEEEARRKAEEERRAKIVYDGLSLDELSAKLERSLNSTLQGQGDFFASYSVELGLDPYLALAITLHETGCKWNCSTLVKQCYNVGGMKGSPGCNGGSYKSFSSMSEGIKAYLDNLYYNYYSIGLTTPETIGPKYAASTTWASQVNSYINEIRAR